MEERGEREEEGEAVKYPSELSCIRLTFFSKLLASGH
jgi:hypothetical protein